MDEWAATWPELAAAATALDDVWVRAATKAWVECARRFFDMVEMTGDPEESTTPNQEHMEMINCRMLAMSKLSVELCAVTLQPAVAYPNPDQERAKSCVEALCTSLLGIYVGGDQWQWCFTDTTASFDFCYFPLVGAAEPTLRVLLTRWSVCAPGLPVQQQIWDELEASTAFDSTPRMLQRCLLFVAGLCRFHCVHADWHQLAEVAANGDNSFFYDTGDWLNRLTGRRGVPGPECIYGDDDDFVPCVDFPLNRLKNGAAIGMIESMRTARREGKLVLPQLNTAQLDALTYTAGKRHIEQVKSVYYKGLWRKWKLLWTCTSHWTCRVGERQGALGGAVGAAALDAFHADMCTDMVDV